MARSIRLWSGKHDRCLGVRAWSERAVIRVVYDRGDGFITIVSMGHADPKICAAVCNALYGAARELEMLAFKFPREVAFEATEHGKLKPTIVKSALKQ